MKGSFTDGDKSHFDDSAQIAFSCGRGSMTHDRGENSVMGGRKYEEHDEIDSENPASSYAAPGRGVHLDLSPFENEFV